MEHNLDAALRVINAHPAVDPNVRVLMEDTPTPDNREGVAEEAERLLHGDRWDTYGDPCAMWPEIAAAWGRIIGRPVTAVDAVRCMQAMKAVREAHRPKRDNLVDIAGYKIIERLLLEKGYGGSTQPEGKEGES